MEATIQKTIIDVNDTWIIKDGIYFSDLELYAVAEVLTTKESLLGFIVDITENYIIIDIGEGKQPIVNINDIKILTVYKA